MKGTKDETEKVYDSISPFFSRRRQSVWPPIRSFMADNKGKRVLDIGCGTGRVLIEGIKNNCDVTGIDLSSGQLESARENLVINGMEDRAELLKGDMEHLPFEDDSFEITLMIASLHHLPERSARINALREMARVLKLDGKGLISVWSWDQERFRERHLSRISGQRDPDGYDGILPGDFLVPWKDGRDETRFYHLYGPGELEDEIKGSGSILERSFFDGRNHWAEIRSI